MRSVIDMDTFADRNKKFQSPKGDTTFTIAHGAVMFVVDQKGNVISPIGMPLDYSHDDFMKGNQSGIIMKVKDFLTVDVSMDSPESRNW
jgi:hypothetical protein